MPDSVDELLDKRIENTAAALKGMAIEGICDDEALSMLVGAYISSVHTHKDGAEMAAGCAIALHRLVSNRAYITELEDRVAMLQLLDVIREL